MSAASCSIAFWSAEQAGDGGDHSHPNGAGYQAMANAISLGMLLG